MSFLSASSLEHLIELGFDKSRNEIRCLSCIPVRDNELAILERVTGIEPALKAWEALVLPLNYTRITFAIYNGRFILQAYFKNKHIQKSPLKNSRLSQKSVCQY